MQVQQIGLWMKMVGIGVVSGIVSIMGYKAIETPQQVIIREEAVPIRFANYKDKSGELITSPLDFVFAAKKSTPCVVNIQTRVASGKWDRGYAVSNGSGVIVSQDGYIATNNHVIEEGDEYIVSLNDNREFTAKLIGKDPTTDLALLKIDAINVPSMDFGNSDSLEVGEWVLAVGNPFNLESTVTAGIVSAKGRSIDILDDAYKIESFIQTDAAVNPGNSGGALINTDGKLIGINTAIITKSGRYEGYSFAVPSNLVKKVINDLREFGTVQRGILGVQITNVDANEASRLSLPNVAGIVITGVTSSGGADEAGLQKDDVIIAVNGLSVKSVPELQEIVGRYRPGNKVDVTYLRNGKQSKTGVTLRNQNNTLALSPKSVKDDLLDELGFELRPLTGDEASRTKKGGVLVSSITRFSVIERTEMDPGYIITKVNEVTVRTVDDVIREMKKAKIGGVIMLEGYYENYAGEYFYTFKKE